MALEDSWERMRRWAKVLLPFQTSPRSRKPDMRELAAFLRSNEPMDVGFRLRLANLLDGATIDNWRLRPDYVGRHDLKLRRQEKRRRIERAMVTAPNISKAIDAIGGSRSDWRLWREIKLSRADWSDWLDASDFDDDTKAEMKKIIWGP